MSSRGATSPLRQSKARASQRRAKQDKRRRDRYSDFCAKLAARDFLIVQAYRSGFTTYWIAPRVGLSRARVNQILHELGVEMRPRGAWDDRPRKVWTTDGRKYLRGVSHVSRGSE